MFVRHQPIGDRLNLPLETTGRYKVTIEKLEKKPEEEKGSKKKNDDTGVPPEHLCTQNEQNIHQEPPPLTAAAKKLIIDLGSLARGLLPSLWQCNMPGHQGRKD